MLVERVVNTLIKDCAVKFKSNIVVGFSGGADSVALLDILSQIGFKITIAYFNHQLRLGVNEEIDFARDAARKYHIDCRIGSKDIKALAEEHREGIEETARFYRYQYLFKIAAKKNAVGIFVAHHADDQVETILMNLIRGSGLKGLSGMDFCSKSKFSDSILIYRPLLNIWKDEILLYCRENNLTFMVDETNKDEAYTRNRIRASLLPTLEKYNPKVKQGLFKTGTILRDDQQFIADSAENSLHKIIIASSPDRVELNAGVFCDYPISIQRYMINILLTEYFRCEQDKTFNLVEDIRKVVLAEKGSGHLDAAYNLHVLAENGSVFIYANPEDLQTDDDLFLTVDCKQAKKIGKVKINNVWYLTGDSFPIDQLGDKYQKNKDMFIAYLDANSVGEQLFIQKYRPGMRYIPLGLSGHSMKLSDFWINKKFPKRKRANWPLIISGQELIWVPGFQPAFSVRITQNTTHVLKLSIEKTTPT